MKNKDDILLTPKQDAFVRKYVDAAPVRLQRDRVSGGDFPVMRVEPLMAVEILKITVE